jgi:transcriptional regulator with XRE-family HTH domain
MVHKAKSDQEAAEVFIQLVGDKIRELRTAKGLSQEKLGELAELNSNYIGQIERGEKSISVYTLKKLANGLSLSLEELFAKIDPANHTDTLEEIISLIRERPVEEHIKILALLRTALDLKGEAK